MIFHKGETTGSAEMASEPPREAQYNEVTTEHRSTTNEASSSRKPDRHIRPTHGHHSVIGKLKRALNGIRPGTPYAVDIVAKRVGEQISVGVYQCASNLIEIKRYIKSEGMKLYQESKAADIVGFTKYVVLSIRGIEIAYGFGRNAKRTAFDQAEALLRNPTTGVISAMRMCGIRREAQLTIAPVTEHNYDIGYILPMHIGMAGLSYSIKFQRVHFSSQKGPSFFKQQVPTTQNDFRQKRKFRRSPS